MNKNTMFVCVASNGQVFDRTGGKNVVLAREVRYSLGNGTIEISQDDDGVLKVRRYTAKDSIGYVKTLERNSAYLITPLFVQMMPRASKDTRSLFNGLKELFGTQPVFKVDEDFNLNVSFDIRLELITSRSGLLTHRFLIRVNPDIMCTKQVEEILGMVGEIAKLDLKILFNEYRNPQGATILRINQSFVETSKFIVDNIIRRETLKQA